MDYNTFHQLFHEQWAFTHKEPFLHDAQFDPKQLNRRAKKEYIKKVIDGHRVFIDMMHKRGLTEWMAQRLCDPSYLSLEWALAYYQLIPESVFAYTSVCTKKTQTFMTSLWVYAYQSMRSSLFFGYDMVSIGSYSVRIAQVEKVLLDYFYLHPAKYEDEDFEEMRIDTQSLHEMRDTKRLQNYAQVFPKTVQRSATNLLHYVEKNV